MNLTLQLSPEDQAELEKRAAASGRDVAAQCRTDDAVARAGGRHALYIFAVVQQELATDENGPARVAVPYRSRNPRFDDSRESIYD